MVYEFLANGFEDIEALAPVDILRRGGMDVKTVSITGSDFVETAHGITLKADVKFEDADFSDAELLLLPGGMPGATNLNDYAPLRALLTKHAAEDKRIGAICAAPLVLGGLGLLEGRQATCYPGFESYLKGARYTADLVTIDGNIITGRGPAAALPYGYAILRWFKGGKVTKEIEDGMIYTQLMEAK